VIERQSGVAHGVLLSALRQAAARTRETLMGIFHSLKKRGACLAENPGLDPYLLLFNPIKTNTLDPSHD